MNIAQHTSAASKAIASLDEFKLTPQEKMAALKTAAAIIDHEVQASAQAQILFNLLHNKK